LCAAAGAEGAGPRTQHECQAQHLPCGHGTGPARGSTRWSAPARRQTAGESPRVPAGRRPDCRPRLAHVTAQCVQKIGFSENRSTGSAAPSSAMTDRHALRDEGPATCGGRGPPVGQQRVGLRFGVREPGARGSCVSV
jgi:hypothetical protein